MSGEEEEQSEPRRPRVVDKRVSARPEAAPKPDPSPSPEIPEPSPARDSTPPSEPASPAPGAGGPEPRDETAEARPSAPQTPQDTVWTPEREAEAQAIAEELARVPALDWVANSAVTLANVAAAKIQLGQAPDAQLAIDALAALLDDLGSRLGEAEMPLKQTLAQLRLAYAQAVTSPGQPGAAP
ncbi:MAG: hypothetical protein GEU78_08370 [Actinobacteria bacterium]|nr:hypothetical protein [Actinomycetota bacterium]